MHAQSLRGCRESQVEPSGCVNGCRCEKGGHQAERCGVFDRHFRRVCHRSCGQIRNHQGEHQLHGRNPGAGEEEGRSCIHRRRTQTQEAAHRRPEGRRRYHRSWQWWMSFACFALNAGFWSAGQIDFKEVCPRQSTGSESAFLRWSHCIIQEPPFKLPLAASI